MLTCAIPMTSSVFVVVVGGGGDGGVGIFILGPALDRDGKVLIAEDLNPNSTVPNTQAFFSQNGGEARLSFKGFAPGYAKSIMSPANFSITVMQIDTWNRDAMNTTG